MYINTDTIITAASVITALAAIFSVIFAFYRWFLRQNKQDRDIAGMKEELTLICYCMSATLDGLMQLDCNHSVPDAKEHLDKYINKKAHEQED